MGTVSFGCVETSAPLSPSVGVVALGRPRRRPSQTVSAAGGPAGTAEAFAHLAAAEDPADVAQSRLAFLSVASEILGSSLDYRKTLRTVAWLAVPHLADWCAIDLVEESGSTVLVEVAHIDPKKLDVARELRRRYPPRENDPGPPRVIQTGESEIYPDIPEDLMVAVARDPEHLEILRSLGLSSAMCVSLTSRGRTLGAITFVYAERHTSYGQDDLRLAEDLARRAATAIDNARLYEERSHIARTLQKMLLPPDLPAIPGLELAARYHPAGEGNDVGGDFYDAFRCTEDRWAVALGDVCGKGAEAAAVTGLTRHTLRAVALGEARPSTCLTFLNKAMIDQRGDERFCTVVFASLTPGEDGARLTVACGGHPLPLILRANGKVSTAGTSGMLLGLFENASFSDSSVELQSGDAILFYTDGVVDGRRGRQAFGEKRLRRTLARCAGGTAVDIAAAVETEVMDFQGEQPRDDIAILVLAVPR